jgi:fido (protein-threonine AMPylation protein)
MDLAVVVRGNDELAAMMLHRFTEVLGRTAREQLLQLLPRFLESFLHWGSFKLTAYVTAITFSQLLERSMRGMLDKMHN